MELVCTRAHYAGDDALHPWDPGDGWSARKAATLWTPSGPAAAAALAVAAALDAGRDRQVFLEAAGVRQST